MNAIWIFKNGLARVECVSFPFAFRAMWNAIQKERAAGKSQAEVTKKMSIISPQTDHHRDPRVYSFAVATEMARGNGLLTPTGEINTNEFKKKNLMRY